MQDLPNKELDLPRTLIFPNEENEEMSGKNGHLQKKKEQEEKP